MASWGFNSVPQGNGGGPEANAGEFLQEAMGDAVAFQDVATAPGDKLKLFPEPWPAENLPPITASLLSIASRRGLFAAAGPDSLVIGSTQKAREQYIPRRREGEDKMRPYTADVTLQVPRVSHVAFSSDESALVIAAEQGGGLAVYDASNLSSGSQPGFQIATNGTSIRQMLPNPSANPEHSPLFAIVLTNGHLLLADLKKQTLVTGPDGSTTIHESVSCVAWSKLGKQVVAGLSDSTCVMIDPQGNAKDRIPMAPQLPEKAQGDYKGAQQIPITSISWLSTHEFMIVYTPVFPAGFDMQENQVMEDSMFCFAQREAKGKPFTFRKFEYDPCAVSAYSQQKRVPTHQTIQRLYDWYNLTDLVVVASSASTDIATLAHFKNTKDTPDEFVNYMIDDEGRKPSMPMSYVDPEAETTPLGMALDYSTRESVPRPVPSQADTISNSPIPVPAVWLLNTDGVLSMWWIVYADAVLAKEVLPSMVYKSGRYPKYKKLNRGVNNADAGIADNPYDKDVDESADETEPLDGQDTPASSGLPAAATSAPASSGSAFESSTPASAAPASQPATSAFGQSSFAEKATTATTTSAFRQASTPGFGQTGLGQRPSPWGSFSAGSGMSTAAPSAFGQSAFGKPSTPGSGSAFGQPSTPGGGSAFGQAPTPGSFGKPSGPAFGQASTPGGSFGKPSGSAFSQASTPGAGTFGKPSAMSGSSFGQVGQMGAKSPFASATSQPGSIMNQPKLEHSPFAKFNTSNQNTASPFANAGQAAASSFARLGQKPELKQENSMGSTATLGSTGSSFGQASGFAGSSFASKPALSKESTMGDESKKSGLLGMGGGFKLGSGFQGDGSAKDDLPKPKNPGGSLFGALMDDGKKPDPPIKQEPGIEKEPSLKDIPATKPSPQMEAPTDDAPLPPDPSTNKAAYRMPDDLPMPPGFSVPKPKKEEKDVPIAGSPPINVTNSQTFSPAESENVGPSEDDDEDGFDEEDEEEEHSDEVEDEEDDDQDDDEEDGSEEDEEEENHVVQDQKGLNSFLSRMSPPSPKKTQESFSSKPRARTPQSDEKTEKSSYTPAGLPKGPTFPPPTSRTQQSPRSPSPQRAVTSPIARQPLPLQIKTTSVPPAKPVERPAAPTRPREPTAGELEDAAFERVRQTLAAPIEPSLERPPFHSHSDYAGSVKNDGIGGQIERVFRDINSMIDVVGLNARSLASFLEGHEKLRKPGRRTRDDLEDEETWCLGDVEDLGCVMDSIAKQLEDGKLERVREKLEDIAEDQKDILRVKAQTVEMRKHITAHTDPERLAVQDAAPLSAETQAQQSELRQRVQRVQKQLSVLEQKMTMLRVDLASTGQTKTQSPIPSVEAVTNTILRMTAMVEQKSGDIDVLEAQIKRLPNGIASLRLEDDYEDDLVSRFGNKLITNGSPAATPPRRPRMAANGDALGMSAMFGRASGRFSTPPSGRQSKSFTPEASALGRSTGSLGGSARKKMADVSVEEVERWNGRVQRRRNVLEILKEKVGRPRVVKVE